MNRYERTRYFERLCALRAAYEPGGVADRFGFVSIAEVIAFAERTLVAVSIPADVSPSHQTTPSASADPLN